MKNRKILTALVTILMVTLLNGCADPLESELTAILQKNADALGKWDDEPLVRTKIKSVNITKKTHKGNVSLVTIDSSTGKPGIEIAKSAILVSYEAEVEYLDSCHMRNNNMFDCTSHLTKKNTGLFAPYIEEIQKGTLMVGKGEILLGKDETGWKAVHLVTDLSRSHIVPQ